MRTRIQNSEDLQAEILRLRNLRFAMEDDLEIETNKVTAKFRLPLMLLSKINHWFSPFNAGSAKNNTDGAQSDWVTSAFRIGLPVMLNKFIFPKSGFILKYVVEFLSQNAAKTLNKNVISELVDHLSDWIKSTKRNKKREPKMADYGIPPDSETY